MLAYKAKLYGRQFITINPRNTTQTCSHCGFIMGTGKTKKLAHSENLISFYVWQPADHKGFGK